MVTPCEIGPSAYDKSPQEAQQGAPHPRNSLLGSLKFSSSSALGTLPLTSLREYPRYCYRRLQGLFLGCQPPKTTGRVGEWKNNPTGFRPRAGHGRRIPTVRPLTRRRRDRSSGSGNYLWQVPVPRHNVYCRAKSLRNILTVIRILKEHILCQRRARFPSGNRRKISFYFL